MPTRRNPDNGHARNGTSESPGTTPRDITHTSPLVDLRGYERLGLIADLAMGELSVREIAVREGCSPSDVEAFRSAFADEIGEVSQALSGQLAIETAGLWITRKQNRIAEYQDQIEELREYMGDLREDGVRWSRSHRDMLRAYLDLFRQAADELGAYPQRSAPPARQGSTVHYVIETGDSEALQ